MKKKKNVGKKKGFSMVELLAAITILGILMAVAIGSVSTYLEKSKKDYFDSQRKNIIAAAKSYYQSNKSELPKNIGDASEVDLKTLIAGKYIGKVYSNDKKTPCNEDETKVKVVMSDKSKYKYSSIFVCQGIDPSEESSGGNDATFTYDKIKNEDTYTLTVKSNDGIKIKHYTYTVTKNGYNYVGPIEEKVNTADLKTRSFTIDRESDNPMNTFVATIRIVDEKGKTHVGVITFSLGDDIKPTCTNIWTDLHEWSNTKTQNITFDCTDPKDSNGYASGCQKDKYHVRLKTKADVDMYKNGIKIKDNAGNEFTCPIQDTIRLDFEAPSCPTITGYEKTSSANITTPGSLPTIASGTWSKKWIFTRATGSKDNAVGKSNNGAGFDYYKVSTTGTTDPANGEKQNYRNVNSEGLSTVSYQACDKLGNCTTSCGSYSVKLDRTPPTNPTANLYKWNGTTTPTSSSGLSAYPNNTWFSGRVFTNATGSTDALRGGVYYQYKTSGATGTANNTTATYKNITEEGISYIAYRACDGLDNCTSYNSTKTIKLDRTAPTVPTVSLYKWKDNNTRPTSSSGLSTYPNNTWVDGKVYTQASGSTDNLTSVSYQFTTSGTTENLTNHAANYRNIEAEGISYIAYRACDEAANCSAYSGNKTIKLDRTAPTVPTVSLYKWKDNNTRPTSASGLSSYSAGSWLSGKVFTTPYSTDAGCGVSGYQYTTTGKTTNDTNKEGSYRNIEAEGSSTIKYRAYDCLGHYSSYSGASTIKLDRTAPSVSISADSYDYKLTAKATDSLSQVSKVKWNTLSGGSYSTISATSTYTDSKSGKTDSGKRYFSAMDTAGNEASANHNSYKIGNRKTTNWESRAYKVGDTSSYNCDKDNTTWSDDWKKHPWKKYSAHFYDCKCTYDYYYGDFISYNDNKEITGTSEHTNENMVIFYQHSEKGEKACKGDLPKNSYVWDICHEGNYPVNASEHTFHGYKFYNGAVPSGGYSNWHKEQWYHDDSKYDDRVAYSSGTGAACKHSCQIAGAHGTYAH